MGGEGVEVGGGRVSEGEMGSGGDKGEVGERGVR